MKATLFTLAKNEETSYNKRNWHNEMKKIKTNNKKKEVLCIKSIWHKKILPKKQKQKQNKKKTKKNENSHRFSLILYGISLEQQQQQE